MNYAYTSCPDHAVTVQNELERNGEDKDWEVVVASDMMLMLDFDELIWRQHFYDQLAILEQSFKQSLQFTESKSRSGKTHVIVHLPTPLTILERIAWQTALGSDPKREALHLLAVTKNEANPIILVMPKVKTLITDGGRSTQPLLTGGTTDEKPSASFFADVFAGASESEAP